MYEGKYILVDVMKAYACLGVEVYLHSYLISVLDGDEWSASRPSRFIYRKRAPFTHWMGN